MKIPQALIQVFIKDGMQDETNMPSQCVLVENMPLNSSGKVDGRKLAAGMVTGSRYSVKPVKMDGKVVDILLVPAAEGENATMGAGIPEELEGDIYNILSEVFAIIPDLNKGRYSKLFKVPGLKELVMKLTGFDMSNIPVSMYNMTPKMLEMAYRKYMMPMVDGVAKMTKNTNKDLPESLMQISQGIKPMMPMMPPMPPMPFMPMVPPMPFMPNTKWGFFGSKKSRGSADAKMDEARSNVRTFLEQQIDMQKKTREVQKDQWNQFFDQIMDVQDVLVSSMPDDESYMPGFPFLPVSPKEFMKQFRDFAENTNAHMVEQADSVSDFLVKRQEQVCDAMTGSEKKAKNEKKEAGAVDGDNAASES
ncbi:MAG: hypothetical protein Q4G47_06975 [Lachnospiraceae bacterium]|nr:hypothetical protein [Lachnospiraceae bacterium]